MTTTPTITPSEWCDVMAGLIGIRLAVYDELLRGGVMDRSRIAQLVRSKTDLGPVLGWLARRRLIRQTGTCWAANSPSSAQSAWEQAGPDEAYLDDTSPTKAEAEPVRERPVTHERPVQAHQAEIFAMEGYGF